MAAHPPLGNREPRPQARAHSCKRVTSPPVSSRVRCRLEAAATSVAAPPRPTWSAQGRKDPRTLPPGRPQFQAWPPWCRRRTRRSPDRSGRRRVSLPRLRRGCTAARRPRSLPILRRIALGHRRGTARPARLRGIHPAERAGRCTPCRTPAKLRRAGLLDTMIPRRPKRTGRLDRRGVCLPAAPVTNGPRPRGMRWG